MSGKLSTFARVRALEGKAAVAFSATLLERMLPNYTLFCEVTDSGDARQFRNTLNSIWEWLSVPKAKINIATQLEKIEVAVPDAAQHDIYGVYPAIDVGMSMSATLLLIQGEDPQGAVVVSKLSQGTVEAYIEACAEEELDNQAIRQHPLMQWEIAFQTALLDQLESTPINSDTTKALRQLARQEDMSNIGIEM